MEAVIRRFRARLAAAQPWAVAAVIIAVGLSLYLAAQGVRYWQAAASNATAREGIRRLERSIELPLDGSANREARLETRYFRLESLRQLFDYPATDTLMSIVSDTASAAGLDLVSMTAEEVTIEPRGSLQYHVRPISVMMDGPTANVRDFLALLYDRVPVVAASSARIVNLNTSPSTQLRLRFYLSPELIPQEDDEE